MKSALQNIGIVAVACLISLAGIEAGLRIWGPELLVIGNQRIFHKFDPVLGWALTPHAEGRFSRLEFSYPVKINSRGMWDGEIASKRPDEFRVAVLGDSFTWGSGVGYGERFTEVVEFRDPRINVLNFGVPGYSTNSISAADRCGAGAEERLRDRRAVPGQRPLRQCVLCSVSPAEAVCRAVGGRAAVRYQGLSAAGHEQNRSRVRPARILSRASSASSTTCSNDGPSRATPATRTDTMTAGSTHPPASCHPRSRPPFATSSSSTNWFSMRSTGASPRRWVPAVSLSC